MGKGQLTGMRGVFLVAAELTKHGFIVAPTARSAKGADLLIMDLKSSESYSIQVKTNASTFTFWLLNADADKLISNSLYYVLVNLYPDNKIEYFVVPSKHIAEKVSCTKRTTGSIWYSVQKSDVKDFENKFDQLG
ncbi:MAG: hypothetical protein M1509_06875 [Nitrospirae bacterium]|nr:hypothetical protein [Nitrospirota bacterium]